MVYYAHFLSTPTSSSVSKATYVWMDIQFNETLAQESTTYATLNLQSPWEYSLGKENIFLIKSENVIGEDKGCHRPIKIIKMSFLFKQLNGFGYVCASSTD